MEHEGNIWVVGGDRRQACLAWLLAQEGHTVHTYALTLDQPSDRNRIQETQLDGIYRADCVILPMTVCRGQGLLNTPLAAGDYALAEVLDRLRPSQFLCGGRVDDESQSMARERGLLIRDYFDREELAVANAVPTAEGAVQIALEELPITIHGSRVLVIGFGRVGRLTAQRFGALGARVTVAARKYDQLAWGRAMGFEGEPLGRMAGWLCAYDLVVNTVPAPVLGRAELEDIREDCLILDLASQPGGVDRAAAEKLGRRVIHALALPGKVAPVTAGAAIRDAIYHMMLESQGVTPERKH